MTDRPRPLPSLDELVANPGLVSQLPLEAVEQLLVGSQLAGVALFGRLLALRASPDPAGAEETAPNGAIGLEEAAHYLGMKESTLYKKWRALGIGYRDADGRVKFTRAALHTYLLRRGG